MTRCAPSSSVRCSTYPASRSSVSLDAGGDGRDAHRSSTGSYCCCKTLPVRAEAGGEADAASLLQYDEEGALLRRHSGRLIEAVLLFASDEDNGVGRAQGKDCRSEGEVKRR